MFSSLENNRVIFCDASASLSGHLTLMKDSFEWFWMPERNFGWDLRVVLSLRYKFFSTEMDRIMRLLQPVQPAQDKRITHPIL